MKTCLIREQRERAREREGERKRATANPVCFGFQQLGTFGRAKRKVDELQGVIAEARRAGH